MAIEDYLTRQFEQLGKVLGKMISMLSGLKQQGYETVYDAVSQVFQTELELDLDTLLSIPDEKFVEVLKSEQGFNHANLDKLAEMLFLLGERRENSKNILAKSLVIYEYLDKTEKVYNFERQEKIARIKEKF